MCNKSFDIPDRDCVDINLLDFTYKQEVVKVDVVSNRHSVGFDEKVRDITPARHSSVLIDNLHTIELKLGNATIRLANNANPDLVK